MKHRLAGYLKCSVEAVDRMNALEVRNWELLETFDPWGERRQDYRAAVICHTMLACHVEKPPSFEKVLTWFDFDHGHREQTDEELEAIAYSIAGS